MIENFELAGVDYTKDEVLRLRNDLIVLRDSALKSTNMDWAVRLSHAIGVFQHLANNMH